MKISSYPSLSKSAEITVLILVGSLYGDVDISLNLSPSKTYALCIPSQFEDKISNLPLYKRSLRAVPLPFSNLS